MIQIIKAFLFGKKNSEEHEIDSVLSDDFFEEAKAVVEKKIHEADNTFEKLVKIRKKIDCGERLNKEDLAVLDLIEI